MLNHINEMLEANAICGMLYVIYKMLNAKYQLLALA